MTAADTNDYHDPILPSDDEREALIALRSFLESDQGSGLALVGSDGEQIEVPASVAHALRRSVAALSDDRAISLLPMGLMIGPEQASRMLQLPLGAIYDLLETQKIPSVTEGEVQWLKLEDVLAYLQELRRTRRKALDELTQLSQELGLYEVSRS